MQDMPYHSQPVDRAPAAASSASGADASWIFWQYTPFAADE